MATPTGVARPHNLSTIPSRPFHTSRACSNAQEPPTTKVQNVEWDPALGEDVVAKEADKEIDTDLVIPPPRDDDNVAPKPYDLETGGVADYTPAVSADGLEVVGGLSGWFNNEKHLPKSKLEAFERFAPDQRVLDKSVLEFCVRRAVVEATVLRSDQGDKGLLQRSWGGRFNAEAAKRVQALNVKVNEKGGPELVGDRDLARAVAADLAAQDEASADRHVSYPTPEEAQQLCAKFRGSWQKISLENAKFRFAVGLLCLLAPFPLTPTISTAFPKAILD